MTALAATGGKSWSEADLYLSLYRAAVNWLEWQDCYEATSTITAFPLLVNEQRFTTFAHEYDLLPWIGGPDARRRFCRALLASVDFKEGVEKREAGRIDKCVQELPDGDSKKKLSAVSKVAMFVAADTFMPIDRFARYGLRSFGAKPREMKTLEKYSDAIAKYVPKELIDAIDSKILEGGFTVITNKKGLQRRTLDQVLVLLGQRWLNARKVEKDLRNIR